jgi:hypothetical protein
MHQWKLYPNKFYSNFSVNVCFELSKVSKQVTIFQFMSTLKNLWDFYHLLFRSIKKNIWYTIFWSPKKCICNAAWVCQVPSQIIDIIFKQTYRTLQSCKTVSCCSYLPIHLVWDQWLPISFNNQNKKVASHTYAIPNSNNNSKVDDLIKASIQIFYLSGGLALIKCENALWNLTRKWTLRVEFYCLTHSMKCYGTTRSL